jgi:hypothetical protein
MSSKKFTQEEMKQLLNEVDEFSLYFNRLFPLLYNNHDFDEREYNKMQHILYKMIKDIKY